MHWAIQGLSLTDSNIQETREISVTTNNISVDVWSSVLTIRALPINDEAIIACIVVDKNLNIVSKGAILNVEG